MLIFQLLAQIPPTPTPVPPAGEAPVTIPESTLWPVAPEVVGFWNQANQSGFFTVVQFLLLAILVVLMIGLIYRAFRQITRD